MGPFLTTLHDWGPLREWIGTLATPILTLAGFLFIYIQVQLAKNTYKATKEKSEKDDLWKKAEFVANQAKDFFTDKRVERVIYMLDWSARGFIISELSNTKILFLQGPNSRERMSRNEYINQEYIQSGNHVIISDALRDHTIDRIAGVARITTGNASYSDDSGFTEIEQFVRDEFDWFLFRLGVFGQLIQSKIISYDEVDGHLSYIVDLISKPGSELVKPLKLYMNRYGFSLAEYVVEERKRCKGETPSTRSTDPISVPPA
jgi:hypothetical protein